MSACCPTCGHALDERTQEDIAFRDSLAALRGSRVKRLKVNIRPPVVHVSYRPLNVIGGPQTGRGVR